MSNALTWDQQRKARSVRGFNVRFKLRDGRTVSNVAFSLTASNNLSEALAKDVTGGKARHYWHVHQTNGADHCTRKAYVDEIVGIE